MSPGDADGSAGADDAPDDAADGDSPASPRLLVDTMCGTLATYLRMCGYDAAYALDRGVDADDRILSLAADEDRLIVTRDRELAARAGERDPGAVLLTERDVLDQLREVAAAGLPVELAAEPTRCGACNGRVERVGAGGVDVAPDDRPEYVPDDVGPSPPASESESESAADPAPRPAWRCRDCGQWFWRGGHWESVADRLDEV